MNILLVEDNPGDAHLVVEALTTSRVSSQLYCVPDGDAALAFLRRQGAYAAMPRPDLILLDLNLPKLDGREVLTEVKTDPALRRIPVIVFTSTHTEQEVRFVYDRGANAYCVKPQDLDGYLSLVHAIIDFWGTRVRLPMA
jgi:chemotaxis family two-component system response regulator Rcp1